DIDERESLVLNSLFDQFSKVLLLRAEATSDERGSGRQRQRNRIDRPFHAAKGHALGLHAFAAGGRGLSGGEAVDLVVHDDVEQIDVAAHGVHEMVAADAETIPVTS